MKNNAAEAFRERSSIGTVYTRHGNPLTQMKQTIISKLDGFIVIYSRDEGHRVIE